MPAGLRGRAILGKGNEVTIGDRIKRIRKKRRLTQAELAMMSGLSLSAIQGYEQGRYEPKRKSIESIAEVFKIPVDELYDMPAELSTNSAEVSTDCISRQALLDKFEPWLKVKDYNDGELNMLKAVLYEIRFMRSAQPKRGWWIEIINSRGVVVALRCSRCEKSPRHGVRSDFCPNCGADMREETE